MDSRRGSTWLLRPRAWPPRPASPRRSKSGGPMAETSGRQVLASHCECDCGGVRTMIMDSHELRTRLLRVTIRLKVSRHLCNLRRLVLLPFPSFRPPRLPHPHGDARCKCDNSGDGGNPAWGELQLRSSSFSGRGNHPIEAHKLHLEHRRGSPGLTLTT
jgi:hypothetical protein